MKEPKYKVGDKVVYDGLIAKIYSTSTYTISGKPCYSLEAEEDPELSCTVGEDDIEPYVDQELDQQKRLLEARIDSTRTRNIVANFREESRDMYD